MEYTDSFTRGIDQFVRMLFPPRCLSCDKLSDQERDLCTECEALIEPIGRACSRCAIPLPDDVGEASICGGCLKRSPHFDQSHSLFVFDDVIAELIHLLKFREKLAVSRLLGSMFADHLDEKIIERPDVLLPVPLHRKRLRSRGFNQSIELSRALAKRWGVPIEVDAVERDRETKSQTGLSAKQRVKNIRGSFSVRRALNVKHAAIIDDVVTTTSTVNELARVLKKHGVRRVDVYSIARAVR